jgi:hypothetical protein
MCLEQPFHQALSQQTKIIHQAKIRDEPYTKIIHSGFHRCQNIPWLSSFLQTCPLSLALFHGVWGSSPPHVMAKVEKCEDFKIDFLWRSSMEYGVHPPPSIKVEKCEDFARLI